jgi:hypothetical protein
MFRSHPDNTLGDDAKSVGGGDRLASTPADTAPASEITDYAVVLLWQLGLRQDIPCEIVEDLIRKDVTPVTTSLDRDEEDERGVETEDSEK